MQTIIQAFLNAHQELLKQQFNAEKHVDLYKYLGEKIIELNFKQKQYFFRLLKDQYGEVFFEFLPGSYIISDEDFEVPADEPQSKIQPQKKTLYTSDLKITFIPPKNNSLSYSGEDAWMNWLKIEGDIATAKYLQSHVKQLKMDQAEILNAFLTPLLLPILGERTYLFSEKTHQHIEQFLNISSDFKNNTLHFLTQERPILSTQAIFNQQQDDLYHLNNQTDRLAQKIEHLAKILAMQK